MTPGIVFFETAMMTLAGMLAGYVFAYGKIEELKEIIEDARRTNLRLSAALVKSKCKRPHVGDINDIESQIQKKLGFKVSTPNDIDSRVNENKDLLGI